MLLLLMIFICCRLMKFVQEHNLLVQMKFLTEWDNITREAMLNKILRQYQQIKSNLRTTKHFYSPHQKKTFILLVVILDQSI